MNANTNKISIGTRGSKLAVAQTKMVRDALLHANSNTLCAEDIEIVVIKTTGDSILDRPLKDLGGKGLFTKEIDQAMLDGRIDIAVHSMKDVPTHLPDCIHLPCVFPREDPRDVLISPSVRRIQDLPEGAVVGTSSLRRGAQVQMLRPDLKVVSFRGNVQSRLDKLAKGQVAATFLAQAGLNRLGLDLAQATPISIDDMVPAIAQGAIGLTSRKDDHRINALIAPLNDRDTMLSCTCERAFLATLDGSCQTPIAGIALIAGDAVSFRGQVLRPDGSECLNIEASGHVDDAYAIGVKAGEDMKLQMPLDYFCV
jgi:hydroxymethylbilane synthase